jgi:hypothetical protein
MWNPGRFCRPYLTITKNFRGDGSSRVAAKTKGGQKNIMPVGILNGAQRSAESRFCLVLRMTFLLFPTT